MKKINLVLVSIFVFVLGLVLVGCKKNDKVITVCASELPHADVLENCVKDILKEKGYTLEVSIVDWTFQNDAVAQGDYDANYFQHIPYLDSYNTDGKLAATCKVHYEPLGIYRGKSNGNLSDGKSFAICNDTSNAIRALQLLKVKGVLETIPVNNEGTELTFDGTTYTTGDITITLITESLLVSSMADYDFVCLPCNTAYTGHVDSSKQVAKEDDPAQVALKANILAVRKNDYLNDSNYKAKIDVLTEALLSEEVATYFYNTYYGAMTCDASSQIDLRGNIK